MLGPQVGLEEQPANKLSPHLEAPVTDTGSLAAANERLLQRNEALMSRISRLEQRLGQRESAMKEGDGVYSEATVLEGSPGATVQPEEVLTGAVTAPENGDDGGNLRNPWEQDGTPWWSHAAMYW